MNLNQIVEKLELTVQTGSEFLQREVTGGYVSDMLSDVLAHAAPGQIWVTLQTHLNIVPVASMKELAGIIIVNGRQPDEDTLQKANEEKIPLFGTEMTAFSVVGKLCQIGVNG